MYFAGTLVITCTHSPPIEDTKHEMKKKEAQTNKDLIGWAAVPQKSLFAQ